MRLFWIVMLLLAGCSSGAVLSPDAAPSDIPTPAAWSEVETVDVPAFDEVLPTVERTVTHDAPGILLRSEADDGIVEEVAGFRVQLFSSINRLEAIQMEEDVEAWLRRRTPEQRAQLGLATMPKVYNIFSSPYFRVRVGDFRERERAQRLRDALARDFQGVLVVPDRVTVVRQ